MFNAHLAVIPAYLDGESALHLSHAVCGVGKERWRRWVFSVTTRRRLWIQIQCQTCARPEISSAVTNMANERSSCFLLHKGLKSAHAHPLVEAHLPSSFNVPTVALFKARFLHSASTNSFRRKKPSLRSKQNFFEKHTILLRGVKVILF